MHHHHVAAQNAQMLRPLLASPGWEIVAAELREGMATLTRSVMEDELTDEERRAKIYEYRGIKRSLDTPQAILSGADSVLAQAANEVEESDALN